MFVRTRKYVCLALVLMLAVVLSCQRTQNINDIPAHTVHRDTYSDILHVSGELESANTYNISCPQLGRNVTVKYIIPDGTYVKKGDTVCILESSEFENDYFEALQELENSKSEYNKTEAGLNLQYMLLQAQVEIIETTTSIKELDSAELKFSSPVNKKILDLELKQAQIEKEKILDQLKFLKKINESELKKMKLRIKQQENRLSGAKHSLDMMVLTSPADGIALRARSWRTGNKLVEGDVVSRRFPLVTIPDLSSIQVKLNLSETQYKRTEKTQVAHIYMDAIPGLQLTGKVKYKEPVGKPINRDSKVKVFGVVVSLDSLKGDLKPGMTASCDIMINHIPDTLVIPYISVFENDTAKYVYVKQNKYFEQRFITMAINNNNFGVVKSGVSENEIISLVKPPESLIKSNTSNEKPNTISADSIAVGGMQQ